MITEQIMLMYNGRRNTCIFTYAAAPAAFLPGKHERHQKAVKRLKHPLINGPLPEWENRRDR
jgi:hypothetical protein